MNTKTYFQAGDAMFAEHTMVSNDRSANDADIHAVSLNQHQMKSIKDALFAAYLLVENTLAIKKAKSNLVTVMAENVMLNHETGYPEKQGFVLYSAPTNLLMAKSLAENLKRCNKSFRIVEEDGKGKIVDFWYREGFKPDDGK